MFSTLAYMGATSSLLKEQDFGKYLSALEYSLPKKLTQCWPLSCTSPD